MSSPLRPTFLSRLLFLVLMVLAAWDCGAEPARYRGANITCADETTLTAEDVAQWKRWGINMIRINFNKDDLTNAYSDPPTDQDPWKPYVRNRAKLGLWLGWLRAEHLEVMISLDALWGDDHNSRSLWQNQGRNPFLNHRIALTKALAQWLAADWPEVGWIEPWNEPHPYDALYESVFLGESLRAVRSVNTGITVVCMAPYDWGLIYGVKGWAGVDDPKVAYSTHIYEPHTYTHQGIYGNPRLPQGWPGVFRDYPGGPLLPLDRASVQEFCAALSQLQERTGKRVFISEFGVLRWAKGGDRYLDDLIAVFEASGYDWLFHSLAGWNGWNPTFAPEAPQTTATFGTENTPAFQVLKTAWAKNLAQSP